MESIRAGEQIPDYWYQEAPEPVDVSYLSNCPGCGVLITMEERENDEGVSDCPNCRRVDNNE